MKEMIQTIKEFKFYIDEMSMNLMEKLNLPMPSNLTMTILFITSMMTKMILMKISMSKICLMIILISIVISYMAEMLYPKSIIPFIIILTMSGGMMVVFMYFTSIMNEKKPEKMKLIKPLATSWLLSWFVWFLTLKSSINTVELNSLSNKNSKIDNSKTLNPLFNKSQWFITVLIMIMLVMVLILSIKMISKSKAPMRRSTKFN